MGQRLLAEKPTSVTGRLHELWLGVGLLCAADIEAGSLQCPSCKLEVLI